MSSKASKEKELKSASTSSSKSKVKGRKRIRVRRTEGGEGGAGEEEVVVGKADIPRIVVHCISSSNNNTVESTKFLWRVKPDEWPPRSLAQFVNTLSTRFCQGNPITVLIRDDELGDEFALAELDDLLDAAKRSAANLLTVRCIGAVIATSPTTSPPSSSTLTSMASTTSMHATIDVDLFAVERRNELIAARGDTDGDNTNTNASGEMRLVLNGPNFRRMRAAASSSAAKAVFSFVGPTGVGKSALIGSLNPAERPVVALPGQVIPTTSNVNAFQCTVRPVADDTFAALAAAVEQPHTASMRFGSRRYGSIAGSITSIGSSMRSRSRSSSVATAKDEDDDQENDDDDEEVEDEEFDSEYSQSQSESIGGESSTSTTTTTTTMENSSATHSAYRLPALGSDELVKPLAACVLDVEGDDGGLPLLEYAKAHDLGSLFAGEQRAVSAADVAELAASVLEEVGREEIESYIERRKFVTRVLLPKLVYVVSDVIVYVNTVPSHRESAYLERVLQFCTASQAGVTSAERPSLILVHNVAGAGPWDVERSTRQFLTLVDRKAQLSRSYRSIDVLKLPHWRDADLYAMQINRLHLLMARRAREQQALKRRSGLLLPERTWFDMLDALLDRFHSAATLSMSRVFAALLVSGAALANRALDFFNALYGPLPDADLNCVAFGFARRLAVRMLAHLFVLRLLERGVGSTVEVHAAIDEQLQPLLARIDARAPCAFRDTKRRACSGEQSTHGDVHRLPGNKKARGTYKRPPAIAGADEVRHDILAVLNDSERLLEAAVAGDAAAIERVHRRRASLLHVAVRQCAAANSDSVRDARIGCAACLELLADVSFSCGHAALCRRCADVLYLRAPAPAAAAVVGAAKRSTVASATERAAARCFACALCHGAPAQQQQLSEALRGLKDTELFANYAADVGGVASEICAPAPLAGRQGLRVLVLDGGGARLAVQLALLERLEAATGARVQHLFDVIGGAGHGGALAVLLGAKQLSLARCRALLHRLDSDVLEKSKSFSVVRSLMARAQFAATKLNALLRDTLGEQGNALLHPTLGAQIGEEQHPKVFSLVATPAAGGSFAPALFANYPALRRVSALSSPTSTTAAAASAATAPDGAASIALSGVPPDPAVESLVPLWYMARASMATPHWFKATQIEGARRTAVYVDGGVVCASPSLAALTECDSLYHGAAHVDVLLSLGVGLASDALYEHAQRAAGVRADTPGAEQRSLVHVAAGDQLIATGTGSAGVASSMFRRAGPTSARDLALEAAAVDAEMRRRCLLVPSAVRTYARIEPSLGALQRECDTRLVAARADVDGGVAQWLGTSEAERAVSRVRASLLGASFFIDGTGADGTPKRAGARQLFVVALRRQAQQPGVTVQFRVACEPRDAFKSIKVVDARIGCSVAYELAAPTRARDSVRVAVFAVVSGASDKAMPSEGAVSDKAERKAISQDPIDTTAARDPERIVHVSGSPFLLHRIGSDSSEAGESTAMTPHHVGEFVDFVHRQPPLLAADAAAPTTAASEEPSAARLQARLTALALQGVVEATAVGANDADEDASEEFFRAAAANVSLHSELKANSGDARRIVARWLTANSDFRLEDGRTLHQRLDSSRDTWTALIERVCTGGRQPGNWLFALALSEALGAPLLIVSGAEESRYVTFRWPTRLQRGDHQLIALATWGVNRWRAIARPSASALDSLLTKK